MAVTDQIKILNRKILQNEAQYNLDREAAKIKKYLHYLIWIHMNI